MFDLNTKVVCIDDNFNGTHRRHLQSFPTKGEIYTIRDVFPAQEAGGSHTAAVLLHEIVNPPSPIRPDWGECGFLASRFAELEEAIEEVESTTLATLTI
jgi:hypothetical protein